MHLQQKKRVSRENAPPFSMTRISDEFLPHALLLDSRQEAVDRVYKYLPKLYASNSPVLFIGEPGTGKETLARLLHYCGGNRQHAFIAVDCASFRIADFPRLFFDERRQPRTRPRQETLHSTLSPTIYLKNAERLSAELQCEFLFLLQDKSVRNPVTDEILPAKIRLLASAKSPLDKAVEHGAILKTLFFRLSTYSFFLPALKDRQEDIAAFADHFRREFICEHHSIPPVFSTETFEILKNYDWPGNLTELRQIVFRSLFQAANGTAAKLNLASLLAESRFPQEKIAVNAVNTNGATKTERSLPHAGHEENPRRAEGMEFTL